MELLIGRWRWQDCYLGCSSACCCNAWMGTPFSLYEVFCDLRPFGVAGHGDEQILLAKSYQCHGILHRIYSACCSEFVIRDLESMDQQTPGSSHRPSCMILLQDGGHVTLLSALTGPGTENVLRRLHSSGQHTASLPRLEHCMRAYTGAS